MADLVSRRDGEAPNADDDIAVLLDRVCAQLPHDYTRRLVRDVVRLKMELGFDRDVRDYLRRRSGEHPAVPPQPSTEGHRTQGVAQRRGRAEGHPVRASRTAEGKTSA